LDNESQGRSWDTKLTTALPKWRLPRHLEASARRPNSLEPGCPSLDCLPSQNINIRLRVESKDQFCVTVVGPRHTTELVYRSGNLRCVLVVPVLRQISLSALYKFAEQFDEQAGRHLSCSRARPSGILDTRSCQDLQLEAVRGDGLTKQEIIPIIGSSRPTIPRMDSCPLYDVE
jgi:hypothetical protein